jgi:hypothetical protein
MIVIDLWPTDPFAALTPAKTTQEQQLQQVERAQQQILAQYYAHDLASNPAHQNGWFGITYAVVC